jgi:hypothetical protein
LTESSVKVKIKATRGLIMQMAKFKVSMKLAVEKVIKESR